MPMKSNICLTGSLKGKFLISVPNSSDSRFNHSVVYICEHSDEEGAMGVVINSPNRRIAPQMLLSALKLTKLTAHFPLQIMWGGPVESARGFVLHSADYQQPSTQKLSSDVYLTATAEILKDIIEQKGPAKAFFALGYTGWTAGQLEMEIAANMWFVAEGEIDFIFDTPIGHRWEKALESIGVNPSMLLLEQGSV